jgi:RNA recognition motif-containing protein
VLFLTAEKAFACYNHNKIDSFNKFYLKLLLNDPISSLGNEPQSNAFILQVKNLPQHTTNLALYDQFRPFGPLFSCRIQPPYKGMALVQFFRSEDAQAATATLVNAHVFFIIYNKSLILILVNQNRIQSIRNNLYQKKQTNILKYLIELFKLRKKHDVSLIDILG